MSKNPHTDHVSGAARGRRTCSVRVLASVWLLAHWWCTPSATANTNGHPHGMAHMSSASAPGGAPGYLTPTQSLRYTLASPNPARSRYEPALQIKLDPSEPGGGMHPVIIQAVHSSLLVLTSDGSPVEATDAIQIGDEIVSIDDVPAWQLGAHGVQALLHEAGDDALHITVRRAGEAPDAEPVALLLQCVEAASVQSCGAVGGVRRWDWTYSGEVVIAVH